MRCQKAILRVRRGAMGGAVRAPDLQWRVRWVRSLALLAGRLMA
jgi:hypothetical protein